MTSTHTTKLISKRALLFWQEEQIWKKEEKKHSDLSKIQKFLKKEYDTIPQKERIGKGSVFITKSIAKGCAQLTFKNHDFKWKQVLSELLELGEYQSDRNLYNLALCLLAEYVRISPHHLDDVIDLIERFATHENWEIRETSGYAVRIGLLNNVGQTLSYLRKWARSDNENLRRMVSESTRPLLDCKWLRYPDENDCIIEILEYMKADSSIYVRTSVGNNLKDLSKYMPVKILITFQRWIHESNVTVTDDLASKTKSEIGEKNYALLWTLKHALRWLRSRNPEYQTEIINILGKNYFLYFDEKKNKLAIPKKK